MLVTLGCDATAADCVRHTGVRDRHRAVLQDVVEHASVSVDLDGKPAGGMVVGNGEFHGVVILIVCQRVVLKGGALTAGARHQQDPERKHCDHADRAAAPEPDNRPFYVHRNFGGVNVLEQLVGIACNPDG